MAGNPLEPFFQACESISHCVQTHLSRLFLPPQADSRHPHSLFKETSLPLFSVFSKPPSTTDDGSAPFRRKKEVFGRGPSSRRSVLSLGIVLPRVFFLHILQAKAAGPLTKEELGRATWTLLHAIAAQYPDQPTRQQKHDVKELMAILSRLYPCKECADHIKEVLKKHKICGPIVDEEIDGYVVR